MMGAGKFPGAGVAAAGNSCNVLPRLLARLGTLTIVMTRLPRRRFMVAQWRCAALS
jgi:hypothetical protein